VETLATVGYGHMYPETFYAHLIAMLEIMVGMFWLAVVTGLIFVRFSRPTARMQRVQENGNRTKVRKAIENFTSEEILGPFQFVG
jgi:hypothetical protein